MTKEKSTGAKSDRNDIASGASQKPTGSAQSGDSPEAVSAEAVTLLNAAVIALGGQHRPGQQQMAEAVADTLASAGSSPKHLLVQAGTGTGKSLAYLAPAVAHALEAGPVVVATATLALQSQLLERDVPRLVKAVGTITDRQPSYAVLKGRHNYVCLDRLHGQAPDEEDAALFETPTSFLGKQALRVREWAESTKTGDRDEYDGALDPRIWRSMSVNGRECVGAAKCTFGAECFAEKARDTAKEADLIITNHAMLAIDLLEGVPVLPEHDAVIIDEGHELVDRATAAVTSDLSVRLMERASSRCRRHVDATVHDRLDDAIAAVSAEIEDLAAEATGPQRIHAVEGSLLLALTSLRDVCHAGLTELASTTKSAAGQANADQDDAAARTMARAALTDVHDVAGALLGLTSNDVAWLDPGRTPTINVAPLSVAGLLRDALFATRPVVMTSATLTIGGGFSAVAGSVGLSPDAEGKQWRGLDVGSPFDFAKQGILYCPAHVDPPGREGPSEAAMAELADLVEAAGGRSLVLLSSWRGVERAAETLQRKFSGRSDRPVLVAQKGDSVADLVRRFAADEHASLVGTLTLWQGVDVPGRSCTLVVIDRIPFPRPDDPIVAARSAAADAAGRNGFMSVSVPRAGLLLAQGVGRLIRSVDDRGVVAVLDPRLATARYGEVLRRSLPPLWWSTDGKAVRAALERLDSSYADPS